MLLYQMTPEYVTKIHILYNQPIYARITITDPDGEEDEIYLNDYMAMNDWER